MDNYLGLKQRQFNAKKRLGELALILEGPQGRSFSDAEKIEISALESELTEVAADLIPVEARRERERNDPRGVSIGGASFNDWSMSLRAPELNAYQRSGLVPGAKLDAAKLFESPNPDRGGWKNAAEFYRALHAGLADQRLIGASQTGGVPSEGGFAMPEQLVFDTLNSAYQISPILQRVKFEPMTGNSKKIAGFDTSTAVNGSLFGGWAAEWIAEGEEMSIKTAKLKLLELVAKKLALLAEASNELIVDGEPIEQQLMDNMVLALRWSLEDTVLNGGGAGRPVGYLNSDVRVVVAKETAQLSSTILYDNLTKMFARMPAANIPNSVWIASSTAIPQLASLSIVIGTGGSAIPVMTTNGADFTILTRPVIFTEHAQVLGSEGDISLVDLTQYALGLRKEASVDKSAHVGFTRDMMTYRATLRGDGMPRWTDKYTPQHGDTQSPFVVLATR